MTTLKEPETREQAAQRDAERLREFAAAHTCPSCTGSYRP